METFYARALFTARADDGGKKRYKFRASSTVAARDGMIIPAGEWRIDNYLRNPVVLLSHSYYEMPIGRATEVTPDDDGLLATVEYDDGDPRAVDVMRKLDGGFVHAVSVGFRAGRAEWPMKPGEVGVFREVELLEISNVSLPSDPNALQLHTAARGFPPDIEERLAALMARMESVEDLLQRSLRRTPDAPAPETGSIDLSPYRRLLEAIHA